MKKTIKDHGDYSLKTRLAFFRQVLANLKVRIASGETKVGLCSSISRVRFSKNYFNDLWNFPELDKYEPKTKWRVNSTWWWNPYLKRSQQHRVEIIEKVIADLENEKKRRGI